MKSHLRLKAGWFYEDLQRQEIIPKKKKKEYKKKIISKISSFHHRRLGSKNRKSRDTQNNRKVWPWSTKLSRTKPNRILSKEHTDHSKHPFPTTQEMTLYMDVTRWLIPKSY